MSSYLQRVKHPKTGKWETAQMIDDFYGPHQYAAIFEDGYTVPVWGSNLETDDSDEGIASIDQDAWDWNGRTFEKKVVKEDEVSANEKLGLPRDKMKTVLIAIDVDGTLLSNDEQLGGSPNYDIVQLLMLLSKMKNTKIIVWSGGGADYAQHWVDKFGLNKYVKGCYAKDPNLEVDIAIDDIQDTAIGKINLIVREK